MDDTLNTLMISALQHFAYCPRQCALIHVEQAWADNHFTADGIRLHQRVDSREPEQRGGVRFERGVAVRSERLGLTGKLDLLEIEGDPPRYFPVEYKRGKPKIEDWDRIQLCAQALCIEEMKHTSVDEGAIWYWQVRRREQVMIDDQLRGQTRQLIGEVNNMLESGFTPPPINDKKRCRACSLVDECNPALFIRDHTADYVAELFAT